MLANTKSSEYKADVNLPRSHFLYLSVRMKLHRAKVCPRRVIHTPVVQQRGKRTLMILALHWNSQHAAASAFCNGDIWSNELKHLRKNTVEQRSELHTRISKHLPSLIDKSSVKRERHYTTLSRPPQQGHCSPYPLSCSDGYVRTRASTRLW